MTKASRVLGCAVVLFVLASGSVSAQSTYVGASLVGDVVRTSHTEFGGVTRPAGGGESIGFGLRVGTPLGSRWGVELEFVRPGEIDTDFSSVPIPLAEASLISTILPPGGSTSGGIIPPVQLFPQPAYRLRSVQRNTTLSTSAWVHQDLSNRVALVYLAGMGFHRATQESTITIDFPRLAPGVPGLPTIFPATSTKSVAYNVRPLAGIEARIGLTDHVQLVPGLRIHGMSGAWLLRPAVGLDWAF
jgi:hypothetical protein